MDKILSIIIPTYNMEKYLHNCLSSLLIGTNQDLLDVLMVNDGSKDSSLAIAREYEEKYPQTFRVIDKPNGNYGSCINRGVVEAQGKYVKVLDADDSYDTEAFSQLVAKLTVMDVDMCLTDYVIVNEQREETGLHVRKRLVPEKIYDAESFLGQCMDDVIMMHEIVYRTEILRSMGYRQTEGIAFTDTEWSLLPLTQVRTACHLPLRVYRYLLGRQGQTVDISRAVALQSQANKTMFVQIEAFNGYADLAPVLRKYMLAHMTRNLRFTYRTYMIIAYKELSDDSLREFDERLKNTNMELYQRLDVERIQPSIPFRFIRLWRRNGYKPTMSVRFFRSIVFPLLRRLGKA